MEIFRIYQLNLVSLMSQVAAFGNNLTFTLWLFFLLFIEKRIFFSFVPFIDMKATLQSIIITQEDVDTRNSRRSRPATTFHDNKESLTDLHLYVVIHSLMDVELSRLTYMLVFFCQKKNFMQKKLWQWLIEFFFLSFQVSWEHVSDQPKNEWVMLYN